MSTLPTIPMIEGQCNFFVTRKKRLCRMTVRPGALFCGEHASHETKEANKTEDEEKRIPCPLDPKHTCYANKLEKHLKVCNAKAKDLPSFIAKGFNLCPHDEVQMDNEESQRRPLSEVPRDLIMNLIDAIEKIHAETIEGHIINVPCMNPHPSVEKELQNEKRADGSKRHLVQASSLLNIMESERLLADDTCFVELGAGKGQVSFYLAEALAQKKSASVLLVDRASHRHKQDNKLDKNDHNVNRIRADICDLNLCEVPTVKASRHVVGVSKHLCGIATDLALTCLTNVNVSDKLKGLVMATCCHHRCEWPSYVGKAFLLKHNISKEKFNVMCALVSWGTCGTGLSRERRAEIANAKQAKIAKGEYVDSQDHSEVQEIAKIDAKHINNNHYGLSYEQRCVIGLKAKAVLDWGRSEYLKAKNLDVKLCFYVDKVVSPENVCIVANKPNVCIYGVVFFAFFLFLNSKILIVFFCGYTFIRVL